MSLPRRLLRLIAGGVLGYFAVAGGLILSQPEQGAQELAAGQGLDFSELGASGPDASGQGDGAEYPLIKVTARDGATLTAYRATSAKPGAGAPLLVLLHGSGWYGAQFLPVLASLSQKAEVLALNLRGHHFGPPPRGDIARWGQFDEDIADVIAAFRKDGQKVIVGGHSSGGGLALRFAGGAYGDMADGVVLMAPFLKYSAPTTRENSGGWAHPLTRRIIGLSMLNGVGIHALDHLTAIQFAMPPEADPMGHATLAYSWRLNQSFAPRDYKAEAAALGPFLLIAGKEDEAMHAPLYEPTLSVQNDQGRYVIVKGAGHLDIMGHPATLTAISAYLDQFTAP